MLHFNHPIRIAERLATIDVLSHGRLELAAVQGNNARTLDAFEVNPLTTVKEWDETLRVVVKALTQETSAQGELYNISPVKVWPRLCQPTFPRTYVSSTGIGTHEHAGSLGLGVQSFTIYGWEHVEEVVRAHQKAVANPNPIPGVPVNKSIARLVIGGQIAATKKEALELARPSALGFMQWLIGIFDETGVKGPDFAYMHDWKKLIAGHEDDIAWMNDNLPQVLNGTPDEIIEGVKRFEKLGFDEVIFRIDGQGHQQIMKSLEYFGKYVIPEFRNPNDIVKTSNTKIWEFSPRSTCSKPKSPAKKGELPILLDGYLPPFLVLVTALLLSAIRWLYSRNSERRATIWADVAIVLALVSFAGVLELAMGRTPTGFVATLPVMGIPLCFSPDCEVGEGRHD